MRRPAHSPDCGCMCHTSNPLWKSLHPETECLVCRADRELLARRVRARYPEHEVMCGACGGSMSAPMGPCLAVFRGPRPYLSRVRYHGLPEPLARTA